MLLSLRNRFGPSRIRMIKDSFWLLTVGLLLVLDLKFQYESVTFLDSCKAVTYFKYFTFLRYTVFFALTSSSMVILLEMHFQNSSLPLFDLTFHGREFGWVWKLLVSKSFSYRTQMTFSHCALEFRVADEKYNTSLIHYFVSNHFLLPLCNLFGFSSLCLMN